MGPWLVSVSDRTELDPWLGKAPAVSAVSAVMLVRGDSEAVREFLPNALDAAKREAGRVVVWVRDGALLGEDEVRTLFKGDDSILAAVLGKDHEVSSWVYGHQLEVGDASFAFEGAAEV